MLEGLDEIDWRALLAGLPIERRSRLVGGLQGAGRAAYYDLCAMEIVAAETIDAFVGPAWQTPRFMTNDLLAGMSAEALPQLRDGLARCPDGPKRAALQRAIEQLSGAVGDLALEIAPDGDGLRATLREPGGDALAALSLDRAPRQEDLAPLRAAVDAPALTRLHLQLPDGLAPLGCRLSDLLIGLGFRSVSTGGSRLERG